MAGPKNTQVRAVMHELIEHREHLWDALVITVDHLDLALNDIRRLDERRYWSVDRWLARRVAGEDPAVQEAIAAARLGRDRTPEWLLGRNGDARHSRRD